MVSFWWPCSQAFPLEFAEFCRVSRHGRSRITASMCKSRGDSLSRNMSTSVSHLVHLRSQCLNKVHLKGKRRGRATKREREKERERKGNQEEATVWIGAMRRSHQKGHREERNHQKGNANIRSRKVPAQPRNLQENQNTCWTVVKCHKLDL